MAISLDAAAETFREEMRQTIKKHSFWYLVEGVLLVGTGAHSDLSTNFVRRGRRPTGLALDH
jgi:hypothetical protein